MRHDFVFSLGSYDIPMIYSIQADLCYPQATNSLCAAAIHGINLKISPLYHIDNIVLILSLLGDILTFIECGKGLMLEYVVVFILSFSDQLS
jgi:hypothetical protein